MAYSSSILNGIDAALTAADIKHSADFERGVVQFGVDCGRPKMNVRVLILAREESFTIYSILPFSADYEDQEKLHAVEDFVCRANYGLISGHFNLDPNDGQLLFQLTLDCTDVESPSEMMVNRNVALAVKMCEKYAPGLQGVIYGGQSSKEACEKCENGG